MAYELTQKAGLADVRRALGAKPKLTVAKRIGVRLNNSNLAGLQAFETWLGGPADLLAFCGGSNGAHDTMANVLTGAAGEIATFSALAAYGGGRRVVWTVSPCTDQVGESGLDVVAGNCDAYLTSIFTMLRDANPTGEIIVRLGHEFNFYSAYPWGAAFLSPAQYVAMFQYCVDKARTISDRFTWGWCPNVNVRGADNLDVDPMAWYPGDGYVDIWMPDAYLQYGNVVTGAGMTVSQAINYLFRAPYGLDWMAKMSALRGKRYMIAEWGIDDDRLAGGINRMYEHMDETHCEQANYWDKNSPGFSTRISDDSKTLMSAAFKPAWKSAPVAWTPQLEWGQNMYFWNDYTDAATITQASGKVAQINNKGAVATGGMTAGGASANATTAQQPTIGTRNGKGSATFDGGDDNLVQTVMSSFMPASNEEKTTLLYGFLDNASTGFQYMFSEADAAASVNKRSIGVNAGVLRSQSAATAVAPNVNGVSIPATTVPPVDTQLKNKDASVAVIYRAVHDTAGNETVQAGVNGSWLTTNNRRHVVSSGAPTRTVTGADATNSGGVGNYCPYTIQHAKQINFAISQKQWDKWSGWVAWQMGKQADLRPDHPYKAAAPQYGLPAV